MLKGAASYADVIARLGRADAGLTFGARADVALSYAELAELVRGNAEHFRALGVRRGDRVALSLETDPEHVVALLALVAMGAVPVSVKPRRGAVDEYAATLGRLCGRFGVRYAYHTLPALEGTTAIGWSETARSKGSSALAEAGPDDLAVVQFSSGSLGAPKAIPIRHGALLANLGAILEVDGRTPGSLVYNFLPLSHDMGLIGGLFSNLVLENPLRLTKPQAFLRDPLGVFLQGACEIVPMPNFALRYLARAVEARAAKAGLPADLFARVRSVFCGAEPIRLEAVSSLASAGADYGFDPRAIVFCYGLAEATLIVTARRFGTLEDSFCAKGDARVVASVGAPVAGTEVRVGARDASGRPVPAGPGVEGAVFIKGPGVFRGYLDDEPVVHEGWFDTGDLGFERDGELYISGRAKDLIIVNGENIFPDDVEGVASRQPGVRECLVLADDDRFYLYLIPEPGAALDPEGVASAIGSSFGAVPARVIAGPQGSILRTSSGKPMRQAMLARLREAEALR
ncbi:MAG TPA: AMP-binding protein [Polyangiaceae bacterium]|nr:AMP-binding protein [Polyangiaceae bacterium]